MTKKIMVILFALSFAACAKIDPEKDQQNTKFVDTTETKVCGGLTPIGQSIVNKSWRMDQLSASGVGQRDIYTFTASGVRLARTCIFGSVQGTVEVMANASINNNSVQILSNDSNSVDLKSNGNTYSCQVSLQAYTLIEYSFMGTCLKINLNNEPHTLIPQ